MEWSPLDKHNLSALPRSYFSSPVCFKKQLIPLPGTDFCGQRQWTPLYHLAMVTSRAYTLGSQRTVSNTGNVFKLLPLQAQKEAIDPGVQSFCTRGLLAYHSYSLRGKLLIKHTLRAGCKTFLDTWEGSYYLCALPLPCSRELATIRQELLKM